jgi:hypothetical protein
LIESLKVPPDDERRGFLKTIFDYFGRHDFKELKKFMDEHAVEQFLYRYESGGLGNIVMPQSIEIRGIDNFINFIKTMSKVSPDLVHSFYDSIITNRRGGSSSISTKFIKSGTPLYEVLMQASSSDVKDMGIDTTIGKPLSKKKKKNDNEIINVNLTDLRYTQEKLDLSKKASTNVKFETGKMIKEKIATYQGRGSCTIHLNKDHKIYLMEYYNYRDLSDEIISFNIQNKSI